MNWLEIDPAVLEQLSRAGVADPTRDCRKLRAWAMQEGGTDPQSGAPSAKAVELYQAGIKARLDRTPVSQIIGQRAFWKMDFEVTPDVLDPRPDTEALVELALQHPFDTLLDLGTGSGCIAVSLLAERPQSAGLATDVSEKALAVARRNAQRAGLSNIGFRQSNWFDGVPEKFDLILSNPPYIRADEMDGLAPEVRDHEPRLALTDEGDGLGAYRQIAAGAGDHLTPGGRLLVEIGWQQGPAVSEIFRSHGFADVTVHPDLAGKPRVVSCCLSGPN